jgi:hypothetical protein
MVGDFTLYFVDKPTWMDIIELIPQEDTFKMNIDMADPFRRDWEWIFGHSLNQYDSRKIYSIFH